MKQLTAGKGEKQRVMYVISQCGAPAYAVGKSKLPSKGDREKYGLQILARVVVSGPIFTATQEEYHTYYEQTALKAAGEHVY
jgi:hypothetical protein